MNSSFSEWFQEKLEKLTKKWWFYLLLILIYFIPSYASKGVNSKDIQLLISEVLSKPLIYTYPFLFIATKVIMIFFIIMIFRLGNKISVIFSLYIGLLTIFVGVFQNMANTTQFGFSVITGNLIIIVIVGLFWILEVFANKNRFEKKNDSIMKWFILPFTLLAFWYPVNSTINPDFSIKYILTNESMLTYCMITPVILTILIWFYPRVNLPTFRVTSFVGILFGIMNMLTWFVFNPSMGWMGVLHIPLFLISIYGFILSINYKTKINEIETINT